MAAFQVQGNCGVNMTAIPEAACCFTLPSSLTFPEASCKLFKILSVWPFLWRVIFSSPTHGSISSFQLFCSAGLMKELVKDFWHPFGKGAIRSTEACNYFHGGSKVQHVLILHPSQRNLWPQQSFWLKEKTSLLDYTSCFYSNRGSWGITLLTVITSEKCT